METVALLVRIGRSVSQGITRASLYFKQTHEKFPVDKVTQKV
jgi:hypothetical protein